MKCYSILLFLCLQTLFVPALGVWISTHDEFHVAALHETSTVHHHHHAFSIHVDHGDELESHLHASDSFQSFTFATETSLKAIPFTKTKQLELPIHPPLEIFLDGLFRPPQQFL